MHISVRKAVKKDCHRMMELVQELAVFEKAPNEVTVDFNHFVDSGFGQNPVWWAFVATTKSAEGQETVQAFALYYVRYSTWKGQRMYLEDLIVTEQFRGQGMGQLLFDTLIEAAKENKFQGISWQVLDWNEPAIKFYKKLDGVIFEEEWVNCSMVV